MPRFPGEMTRRNVVATLAALGAGVVAGRAAAQTAFRPADATLTGTPQAPVIIPAPPEPEGLLSHEVVELWPAGRVPGAEGMAVKRQVLERGSPAAHDRAVMHVSRPILEVFRPEKPNGAAMVLLPGGAYVRLAVDKEGAGGARRLMQEGITCFVLNYRLPGDKWPAGYDVALQDVQRAVRMVRGNAAAYGIDPKRIGVMGFSAGGHLAAAALTRFDAEVYEPVDAIDAVPARPDVVMLGYAVTTVGVAPVSVIPAEAEAGKPLQDRVRAGLAPVFILHTADDRTVPVANSLAMYQALQAAGVPVEMHLYQLGGHGFGFSLPDSHPTSRWPDAFVAWLKGIGFM
jgi:acetyl esterase/lipase